jgi:mannose-6-phosphate isomerase-like protein (cupin superfamily)
LRNVKAVKLKGEFVWHHHDVEDELFIVDREEIIRAGEFLIVPHGVEHQPVADEEVHLILLEPKGTLNAGNVTNERTVRELERL